MMIIPNWRERLGRNEKQFADDVERYRNAGEGYGAMMQIVSFLWYEKDPVGALSVGHAYGSIKQSRERKVCINCERKLKNGERW